MLKKSFYLKDLLSSRVPMPLKKLFLNHHKDTKTQTKHFRALTIAIKKHSADRSAGRTPPVIIPSRARKQAVSSKNEICCG